MRLLSIALTVPVAAVAAPFDSPLAAQQRPMTFMDVQEMKRAGSWTPSPDGSWMLYTVTTPNWEEADSQTDIHLVSLMRGRSVRPPPHLHGRQERDESGLGSGRVVLPLFVQPRRGRQPALHDAPRRGRGTEDHRRGRGRLELRLQSGWELAGLPRRREWPGTALPAAGRRPRGGGARAAHRWRGGRRPVGLHPGRKPGLLHAPRRVRRGREEAAGGRLHGRRAERGHASLGPVERRGRRRPKSGARPTTRPTASTASRSPTTAAGSGSPAARRSATSATSRGSDCTRTSTSWRWPRARSSA